MTKDITRLKRSLEGDVLDSAFDRGRYATDASIYQMMPLAVITEIRVRQRPLRARAQLRDNTIISLQ